MTTHDETSPATGPDGLFEETLILPTGQAVAVPEGGESSSVGGMGRQILQVFLENRLAVVGLFVIVFFILFCFVGPAVYHTNQTNSELALLNSTQNAPPPQAIGSGKTCVSMGASVSASNLVWAIS